MSKLYTNKLILTFFMTLFSVSIHSSLSAFANQGIPPQLEINTQSQRVHILAKEYPLGKLLHSIRKRTGIQVRIPESLNSVPVDVDILGNDWKSALKKLFQDNSRFEVWGKSNANSKIWLYEYENHPVTSGDFVVLADAKNTLSKQEILRLAKESRQVEQRLMAMEHFSYLSDDEETLPLLIFSLQANEAIIRSTSLSLFKNFTEPLPLSDIEKIAQSDSDPKIQMQALSLIAERVDEESSIPILMQALNNPSTSLRYLAQELLDDLGFSAT